MDTRTKTFKVPIDLMPEFADKICHHELPCELMGVTKKNKIIFDVDYEPDQRELIHELTDMIEDYIEEQEEEE